MGGCVRTEEVNIVVWRAPGTAGLVVVVVRKISYQKSDVTLLLRVGTPTNIRKAKDARGGEL